MCTFAIPLTMSNDLRRKLSLMGKSAAVSEHPQLIEDLRQEFDHTIRCLKDALGALDPKDVTCFAYALGIQSSAKWPEFAREGYAVNTPFIEGLIDRGTLEPVPSPSTGDLVVYSAKRVVHAGVLTGHRVVSKWGIGFVYEHELWEVPSSYGSASRFFRRADLAAVDEAFIQHLKTGQKDYWFFQQHEED